MASKNHGRNQVYVFLGRTGVGKSSTCNTLIGYKKFPTSIGMGAKTQVCDWAEFRHPSTDETIIKVIDTPGVFDSAKNANQVVDEIAKCMGMALTDSDGVDAFILVLKIGESFTKESIHAIRLFEHMFGEDMVNHILILFTRAGELDNDGMTLQDYVQHKEVPVFMQRFLHRCRNRVVAIENSHLGDKKQISDVVRQVDRMRSINGHPFNNQVVEYAKKIVEQDSVNYSSSNEQTTAIAVGNSHAVPKLSNFVGNLIVSGVDFVTDVVHIGVEVVAAPIKAVANGLSNIVDAAGEFAESTGCIIS